ncbi:TcpQ domain-containing protein [Alcaligenes aquatilis]|uniref:TcpQ domain-containing protein n=1 Tax=Alcaligenes aquatilis TaxID=323284 RepID=UPI000F67B5D2|nr:TcpQ domain-containing protein [Alcaligenes aquatilis]QXR34578.1 TcpQ domain-containing protein [Alcaligenes aquatilis]
MRFLVRFCVLLMCALGLSACQTSQGPDGLPADPGARVFNFDWRLSGDPQVGPMQVFDNGTRIWLHFAPEQRLPAVFGRRDGQEVLLSLRPSGQFQLIDGLWAELVFRAGRAQAQASLRRKSSQSEGSAFPEAGGAAVLAQPLPVGVPLKPSPVGAIQPPVLEPGSAGGLRQGAGQKEAERGSSSQNAALPASLSTNQVLENDAQRSGSWRHGSAPVQSGSALTSALGKEPEPAHAQLVQRVAFQASSDVWAVNLPNPDSTVFELRLKDRTLRQALMRWAKQAKWVFASEHWTLEVDFPVKAAASFKGSFESAVVQLLTAAQLNAHSLQACFYSNQVLRVLASPQPCDPSMQQEQS